MTNPRTIQPRRAEGDRRRGHPQARPRGRGDRHVGDPPRRSIVCGRLRRLPTADHLGRASRTCRRVRHRGHRQLRGGTRARGPASRAPGARSEPGRPAHPSNRREVRHRGCRDRRAVGPGWPIDRYPEDRGRGGRDDAPPQGRAPDGGQSPHLGDDHAEADRRHRAARAARDPSTRSPTRRSSNAAADGAAARSIRRPPRRNIPSGRSPVAGSLSPSRSWTTTVTWVDSPTQTSPTLREGLGIGADTAAEMLIIFGDNPDRSHSEAAFAKLCGACPIPASSGMTTGRHRLYRGGHRQANAALHRAVIVRMRYHSPTLNYVERRTAEGRPKREIIRCLKRFLAREIFQRVMADYRARQAADLAA